jgi:hypothetical protein
MLPEIPMPIRATTCGRFAAVELTTPGLQLIAVHGMGPRICHLSLPGAANLLMWDGAEPPKYARKVAGREDWALRGGHRLWTSRGPADESEETYRPDNAAGTCEIRADGFTVAGALDPETRTRRSLAVTVLADHRVQVDNILVNESDMLYGCGLWALSCTLPTATSAYVVPLGDGSNWDTATITVFKCWGGHGQNSFRDDQWQVEDDAVVLRPKGRENKRIVGTPTGTIALTDPGRKVTFAIQTAYEPGLQYPTAGNIAMYVGPENFMVEMETMGPMAMLKQGQRIVHRQIWTLLPQAVAPTGAAVMAVVK